MNNHENKFSIAILNKGNPTLAWQNQLTVKIEFGYFSNGKKLNYNQFMRYKKLTYPAQLKDSCNLNSGPRLYSPLSFKEV